MVGRSTRRTGHLQPRGPPGAALLMPSFVATVRASWARLRPAEPLSRDRGEGVPLVFLGRREPTTGVLRKTLQIAEALCRTRTGDPFLTMAVCLGRAMWGGRSKRPQRCRIRDSAAARRLGHRSAPSVTHSVPG